MKYLFSLMMVLAGLLISSPAMAKPEATEIKLNVHALDRIPVQHDGRIKPLLSFADATLETYSGHTSLKNMDSMEWLVASLFDPSNAIHIPVFRIFDADILGLPDHKNHLYSLADIAPKLQEQSQTLQNLSGIKDADLSHDQVTLLTIKDNAENYIQILRSFSMILPVSVMLAPETQAQYGIVQDKGFTLLNYKTIEERVIKDVRSIIKRNGQNPEKYTDTELAITRFSYDMQVLQEGGQNNTLVRLFPVFVPTQDGAASQEWLSPWQMLLSGQSGPETTKAMDAWKAMAQAYYSGNQIQWNQGAEALQTLTRTYPQTDSIGLEILYTKSHSLMMALVLFAASFMGALRIGYAPSPTWRRFALGALWAGSTLTVLTVLLRILILARPPVGTLYESVLFVAALCTLACALLETKRKDLSGLMAGSLSGTFLLFTAQSLAEPDTLKVLTAVLNTNFWLATHVLCITAGYAWCLVVSLMAHLWLYKTMMQKDASSLLGPIRIFTLIALLFTAVGTILGGVWADQSWGRFWGWDPKENGALLIVLWLAWILHAQITGQLKRLGVMMALSGLSLIVAIAWFGVNLLNVGLHSYGFINGIAYALGGFAALEVVLIFYPAWKIAQKTTNPQ